MGCNVIVKALLVAMLVYGGNCRAIDQTIRLAELESRQGLGPDSGLPSNVVKVESDMLFDTEEYKVMQRLDAEGQRVRKKRKAIRDESKRWTNKVVPYRIGRNFSETDKEQIQAAVKNWNTYTCLNFRPYQEGDDNYINMQDGEGCSSYVGMQGGSQVLTLAKGCRHKGIIIHEMGHVIGFHHEQTRPDRDQYAEIINDNIKEGKKHNFKHQSSDYINDHGVPYDYLSIMHYGERNSGVNGSVTILTKDPDYQYRIGNLNTLTFNDVKLANLMYKCGSHCAAKTCPGDGFVGTDCKCYCPGHEMDWMMPDNPTKQCTCVNQKDSCDYWAQLGYCSSSINTGYMRDKCPVSCDLCSTAPNACINQNVHCAYWAQQGHCSNRTYARYMRLHCRASCNLCNVRECVDNSKNCVYWASIGECYRNPAKMVATCKKSCWQC